MILLLLSCEQSTSIVKINTDPTLTVLQPQAGTVFEEGETITFEALVGDRQDPPESLQVAWSSSQDGALFDGFADTTGHSSFETTLTPGTHTLTVTAFDTQDGLAETSFSIAITDLDDRPTVEIQSPLPGQELTEGEFFTYSALVSDSEDAPRDLTIQFISDLDGEFCTPLASPEGVCSCDKALSPGDHVLTVVATDTEGNAGSAQSSFSILALSEIDNDGDGWTESAGDCADNNAEIYPDAPESCNGLDDDCDSLLDEGTSCGDDDGDGFSESTGDCNDADASVFPGAIEVCDGVDNDCEGGVDEAGASGAQTGYLDADGDGFGDALVSQTACVLPSGYVLDNSDCDDRSAVSFPGGVEVCDGLDNDCDGNVDINAIDATSWYQDGDGDGFGDASVGTLSCSQPLGYVSDNTDCNDILEDVYPGAPEACDGIDQDCDGEVDEGVQSVWFEDADGDGYGNPASSTESCGQPSGYVANSGDCDDNNASLNPETVWYLDSDGDGYGATNTTQSCTQPGSYVADSSDCDDSDATISPIATELCDGVDNNCNGEVDEDSAADAAVWYFDGDGDGFGDSLVFTVACTSPPAFVADNTDCNDSFADIYPGAPEDCDGVDQDCDGLVDEDVAPSWYQDADGDSYGNAGNSFESCTQPSGFVANSSDCDDTDADINPETEWYLDSDGDGFGDNGIIVQSCLEPLDYVGDNTDCDDVDSTVFPGADEYCDGIDNNCNGVVDEDSALDALPWYFDGDGDGYGTGSPAYACSQPVNHSALNTDCNDSYASIFPGAPESCNSVDDDCDGSVDESVQSSWYRDADGDGYGNPAISSPGCSKPSGYVGNSSDCDDNNANINPATVWYRDSDNDGYGTILSTTQSCTQPSGYVAINTDCNDSQSGDYPGATEYCDSRDNDCDGTVDDTPVDRTTWYRDADNDGYGSLSSSTLSCTQPSGYVANNTDCNDNNAALNPATIWYRDADGDGYGSSSATTQSCTQPSGYVSNDDDCDDSNAALSPATLWYPDADGDGYGNPLLPAASCTQPSGYVSNDDDCNDANASLNPTTVWYRDGDGDGYGIASRTTQSCTEPSGYVSNSSDCNDQNASINPETYWYADADGDGYGDPDSSLQSCTAPSGYIADNTDCNDDEEDDNPDATETCDGRDNDCDSTVDEANADNCTDYYYDGDGDGYGTTTSQCLCSATGSYTARLSTDCYDSNASVHPGQTTYFSVHRGDGSFDYNCDSSASKRYTSTYSCTGAVYVCVSSTAGYTSSVPACGNSGTWGSSCSATLTTCGPASSVSRQQTCR